VQVKHYWLAVYRCEAEIISHYIGKEHVVVLLEEAVIATEQNRKLLSSAFVVYLKVSTPVQLERMQGGRMPLLPITDLIAFRDKQHLERDSFFEGDFSVSECDFPHH
jgi:shikimate kinase